MSTAHQEPQPPDDDAYTEIIPIRRRPKIPVLTATLVLAIVAAAGVIGGIQIQKHYGPSGSSATAGTAASFAGRLRSSTTGTTGTGSNGQFGFGRAGGGVTIGDVKLVKGSVLYVTDTDGNTVKVKTTAASRVTKTVTAKLKEIRPGDTVVVQGTSTSGTVTATSISIGGASSTGFGGFGSSSSGGGFGSNSSGGGFGG